MRDYRGRSGITLRSRRRPSRARVVGVGLLIVAIVVAALIWWPRTGPDTDPPEEGEQVAQPNVKGAIPLKIPGQTPQPEASESE